MKDKLENTPQTQITTNESLSDLSGELCGGKNEPQCNCPCMDCIEGNHCGEEYDITGEMMGDETETKNDVLLHVKCEYINYDDLFEDEHEDDEFEDEDE